MTSFDTLGLGAQLLSSVEASGFTEPTPIQAGTIPLLLEGRDVMATAQTGGGKTAAYLLPLLHKLAEQGDKAFPTKPRALILAPTRELAIQIGEALRQFSKGLRLYYTVIYGGTPFMVQRKVLERGVHILVATPGRLMDHLRRNTMTLDSVDNFILDEADRMLDMGFVDEVKEVAAMLPAAHQTVMFSATMNKGVRGLAAQLLNNPGLIEIGRENSVAADVDHRVMRVRYPDKKPLLLHLLGRPEVSRVLVFTRTKAMADTLVDDVRAAGLKAAAIHGDLEQSQRQRVLRSFREGVLNTLIATDVAARGIDVPDITHVINYDMPIEAEAYVHRVGRTGRAGAKGVALSICTATETNLLRNVERLIGIRVPVDIDHPFHESHGGGQREPRPLDDRRPARPAQKPFANRESFANRDRTPHRRSEGAPFQRPEAAPSAPRFNAPRIVEPRIVAVAAAPVVAVQPIRSKPAYSKPAYGKPAYGKPAYAKPAYAKPAYSKPEFSKPEFGKPEFSKPGASSKTLHAKPGTNPAAQREDQPNKVGTSFRRGKNARIAAGLVPRSEFRQAAPHGKPHGKPGADGSQPRRRSAAKAS